MPANPRAWLVSTGRFKAIDAVLRRARFDASQVALAERLDAGTSEALVSDEEGVEDDRLRLSELMRAPEVLGLLALIIHVSLRSQSEGVIEMPTPDPAQGN